MIIWYGKMAYICAMCWAKQMVLSLQMNANVIFIYIYVKNSDCRKTLQMTLNESMREGT